MGSLVRWKNGDARVVLSGALFDHPSGVAIASDGKAIWLSTSGYSTQHSALYRLPLSADSQLGTPELIASGLTGAAGIAVDIEDNAYVANGKDITVFSHSGTSLGSIPVLAPESRERVLDLAFGGSNRTTLFIGTGTDLGGAFTPMGQYVGGLYSVKLRMPGIRR
jgi:sugar lactone lactonase YvrE